MRSRQFDGKLKVFLIISILTLSLNFGYAIKTSILFGLVLVMLHGRHEGGPIEKN
jgi:hypothetical protein